MPTKRHSFDFDMEIMQLQARNYPVNDSNHNSFFTCVLQARIIFIYDRGGSVASLLGRVSYDPGMLDQLKSNKITTRNYTVSPCVWTTGETCPVIDRNLCRYSYGYPCSRSHPEGWRFLEALPPHGCLHLIALLTEWPLLFPSSSLLIILLLKQTPLTE